MDETRIAERAEELGAPITDAEREQAAYALAELRTARVTRTRSGSLTSTWL